MCGRFMLATSRERLIVRFCLQQAPELTPRYNIAPSQYIAAVRQSQHQGRELAMLHWGLIPHWAKQP
ncbi:MAG: SOS response-associated peptidase family protein, partial [Acidiferrobacterales bacterium]